MKRISLFILVIALAGVGYVGAADEGAPPAVPSPQGTAAILAAGTDTVGRLWSADDLASEFSGATVEVEDDAYGAGWNGDTTHSPSQNAVYDVLVTMLPSIDEDNMASNSDAHVPTQQSVKAYADSVAGAPTNVTPVDTADEDATFYPLMVDGATGSQATETDGELTYNPSTGLYTIPNIALGTQAITDNAIVTVDQDGAADNDFAKFTAAGVEGRSYSEVISDLGLNTLGGLNTATSVVLIQYVQSAGAPDADDDITTYLEGTLWQDTSDNDNIYQLTDNTDGAAVWICITCVETLDDNDVVSLIGTAGTNTPTLYAIDTDLSSVSASDDTWASAKAIKSALDGKQATLTNPLVQTDVDDTPVNGVTTAPVSSNWAYDHEADTSTHGVTGAIVGTSDEQTLTGKTFDANGTGNVLKGYGYITLPSPHVYASGVTQQTTVTARSYGQALFPDEVDVATNYVEYILEVPRDLDTSVDLVAWFSFVLSDADTADHDYVISMIDIAASADNGTAVGDAINLDYTADASGASGDVETAGGNTLTGWAAALTAGSKWIIRIARDGDDETNDASTVDSISGPLTIRYGFTQ